MENTSSTMPETVQVSSFMTRATNVFMSPGELYSEVASAPVQNSSWVIPYILLAIMGVLMTMAIFSNETLKDQIMKPQREAIQKQVAEGKMTQEQADAAESFMKPGMFMAIGAAGAIGVVSVTMFLIPLVLLLAAKMILTYSGVYKKMLETYGLATLIGLLGALVSLLMMYSMDSMYAQPSGAFFIKDVFEPGNFGHNVLASMNIFSIWQTAVLGIGVSKISGSSTGKSMAVVFGLWILWVCVSSALGWGAR
jgi:hypothetical protein